MCYQPRTHFASVRLIVPELCPNEKLPTEVPGVSRFPTTVDHFPAGGCVPSRKFIFSAVADVSTLPQL